MPLRLNLLPQRLKLFWRQFFILNQPQHQRFGRAAEETLDHRLEGIALGTRFLNDGFIYICLAAPGVPDSFLLLQNAQQGAHRRIMWIVGKRRADLLSSALAACPQNTHDLRFSLGKCL